MIFLLMITALALSLIAVILQLMALPFAMVGAGLSFLGEQFTRAQKDISEHIKSKAKQKEAGE